MIAESVCCLKLPKLGFLCLLFVVVVLCDPIPYQGNAVLLRPTKTRGPWSRELSGHSIFYLSKAPAPSISTRDNLKAWIKEHFSAKQYLAGTGRQSEIMGMAFTLAYRDTTETLTQIDSELQAVERAMLDDASIQDDVLTWRDLLNKSRGILEELDYRLPEFLEKYSSFANGLPLLS